MRTFAISSLLTIALGFLFIYMVNTVINPLQESKVDELVALRDIENPDELYAEIDSLIDRGIIFNYIAPNRLMIVLLIGILTLTSFITSIHLVIDKLFFKEFYRPPDLFPAMRRGFMFSLALVALIILRYIGMPLWQATIGFVFVFLLEVLFSNFMRSRNYPVSEPEPEPEPEPEEIINDEPLEADDIVEEI